MDIRKRFYGLGAAFYPEHHPDKSWREYVSLISKAGLSFVRLAEFTWDKIEPEDHVYESHGAKVIVDAKSLIYLDGTELDYAREGLNEGFKFNNPNVKNECGCGESFNV